MNNQLAHTPTRSRANQLLRGAFAEDYHAAVGGLRRALRTLLVGAGGDPSRPQSVARGFGLDKNLAWKVSRLVEAEDDVEALRFLPGPAGRRMLCEAIGARASSQARIEVEQALELFDRMVIRHAGDRASLDVLAQCLDPGHAQEEVLQQARKQAFLGNRATWGAQAAAQYVALAIGPAESPDLGYVCLQIGGLLGFRRIRGDVRWRLLDRPAIASDDHPALEPLVPSPQNASGAPLLTSFCTQPTPDIGVIQRGDEVRYLLEPGEVGRSGEIDCVHALKASHPAEGPASEPSLRAALTTPVETVELALLVHREVADQVEPSVTLEGLLDGDPTELDPLVTSHPVPVRQSLEDLASTNPSALGELLTHSVELAGWSAADFEVWTHELAFPPIPSIAIFKAARR